MRRSPTPRIDVLVGDDVAVAVDDEAGADRRPAALAVRVADAALGRPRRARARPRRAPARPGRRTPTPRSRACAGVRWSTAPARAPRRRRPRRSAERRHERQRRRRSILRRIDESLRHRAAGRPYVRRLIQQVLKLALLGRRQPLLGGAGVARHRRRRAAHFALAADTVADVVDQRTGRLRVPSTSSCDSLVCPIACRCSNSVREPSLTVMPNQANASRATRRRPASAE